MAQILTSGTPGATRTPDLRIRSPTLYPTELRAHPSFSCGVSEGDRTLGHRSHNPALYHLSYTHHIFSGTPERIRTSDLRIRSPLLFPAELQAGGSPLRGLVGARGFEPPTPCAQGRCATRLRYTPTPHPLRLAKDPRFRPKGEYMFRAAGVSTCVPPLEATSREPEARVSRVNRPLHPLLSRRSAKDEAGSASDVVPNPARHGVARSEAGFPFPTPCPSTLVTAEPAATCHGEAEREAGSRIPARFRNGAGRRRLAAPHSIQIASPDQSRWTIDSGSQRR